MSNHAMSIVLDPYHCPLCGEVSRIRFWIDTDEWLCPKCYGKRRTARVNEVIDHPKPLRFLGVLAHEAKLHWRACVRFLALV